MAACAEAGQWEWKASHGYLSGRIDATVFEEKHAPSTMPLRHHNVRQIQKRLSVILAHSSRLVSEGVLSGAACIWRECDLVGKQLLHQILFCGNPAWVGRSFELEVGAALNPYFEFHHQLKNGSPDKRSAARASAREKQYRPSDWSESIQLDKSEPRSNGLAGILHHYH